jgi:hypothetical protein
MNDFLRTQRDALVRLNASRTRVDWVCDAALFGAFVASFTYEQRELSKILLVLAGTGFALQFLRKRRQRR